MNKQTRISIAVPGLLAFALFPSLLWAADAVIPKPVLIQLTREQSAVMCSSKVFTDCMEISQQRCTELSEQAIEMCLAPLPDLIDPASLRSSTLEECPQQLYQEVGISEDHAKQCLNKALAAAENTPDSSGKKE